MNNERVPIGTAGHEPTSTVCLPNSMEEEPQLEDKIENELKIAQARPGRRPARWNLADQAWPTVGEIRISQPQLEDKNLAGWVRLRPVIRIYHGRGQAQSARPGLAMPYSRELAPPAKLVGLKIRRLSTYFEYITRNVAFFSFFRFN